MMDGRSTSTRVGFLLPGTPRMTFDGRTAKGMARCGMGSSGQRPWELVFHGNIKTRFSGCGTTTVTVMYREARDVSGSWETRIRKFGSLNFPRVTWTA